MATQLRDLTRQLDRARRRLAQPERDRGQGAGGVAHAHDAGLDPADLPRVGAEQEDVARHGLDGPVFVDGADERVVGLGHDAVVTGLGNRAPRRCGGDSRALAPPQLTVDGVVVHVRSPPAPTGLDPAGDELDDLVELVAGELGVRRRPAHELVQLVGAPFLRRHLGDDLLGGDVERLVRELDGVEPAGTHGDEKPRALDELVARQRVEPPLRRAGARVVRPADALQERGDAARRADLAHELDRADVDAELQRRGGHERLERAGAEARLDPPAALLGQAAVVRGHDVVSQALAELVREPLRHPPGVDEHQGGLMVRDVLGDAIDDI